MYFKDQNKRITRKLTWFVTQQPIKKETFFTEKTRKCHPRERIPRVTQKLKKCLFFEAKCSVYLLSEGIMSYQRIRG